MFGSSTSALIFGGTKAAPNPVTANTELWNGSSWSEQNDLNLARTNTFAGVGTSTAGIAAGGYLPGSSAVTGSTESWSNPATITKTVSTD